MRVLIISHNVFSTTESMGKTLSSYFTDFEPDDLAQFYIHSQIPTSDICRRYYRITDKEAIESIFGRKVGKVMEIQTIENAGKDARTDTGLTAFLYQKARDRTPVIYLLRNQWWKMSHWNDNNFQNWLDDFSPECIFFAAGDYAFMYDIALKIARRRDIPLYTICMDDFFLFNRNENSILGRIQYKLFMRSARQTLNYTKKIFCICEKMSREYGKYFKKECITIHTPATFQEPEISNKCPQISYLGNLGNGRNIQLIKIGRTLKKLNLEPNHVDVYSTESRPNIIKEMTLDNGIIFHGDVSPSEVYRIMNESLAVIHTESFDESNRQLVRYSVSTKIADSLMSGTCIFAYGPSDIASIEYLKKHNAALCCTSSKELGDCLSKLISDDRLRKELATNALHLAKKNHSPKSTLCNIRKELERATIN